MSASSWFCYKEICYYARSHESKKNPMTSSGIEIPNFRLVIVL